MTLLLLASALVVGGLLAVQSSVNVRLNAAVGTPFGASTIQLGVAATALFLVALATGTLDAARLVADVPAWQLLAGIASPIYITTGILLFPRLGALVSVGLFVTGQVLVSLVLDVGGLIGVEQQPLTLGMVAGALAVLAGITVVIRAQHRARRVREQAIAAPTLRQANGAVATRGPATHAVARARTFIAIPWLAAGVVAGGVLPIQGAINAQVRRTVDASATVGMISFIVATASIALALAVLVALRRTPRPQVKPLRHMPWWGWLGGFAAATYVVATFSLIPVIGAAPTVALTVTGQQVAAASFDHTGLFGLPIRRLSVTRMTGLVLLVAGSALVQLG
ncbi:MAG: EamA-like transporter family protein [Propionibacteriales bacterium]|nr:EamA-like transporter family protein [Propionibacteriales bacterium]